MVRRKPPKPGSFVLVRQRQYLVEEVVSPASDGEMTLVRLACVQDDAQGQPLEVLWEAELDARPIESASWEKLSRDGFDTPQHFASYLHTLEWNCVTATDPTLFQSPFRAGIHLDVYQLEPLRKALLLPRVNLFIADDVGLGKTIEAGLILRELLLRKKVRHIVIAAPPSVLPQWQLEMENRFGLPFIQVDKDFLIRTRRERGFSTNPWRTHSRFIISHRLLIDEYYTEPLRQWLGEFSPGSLLVVDEAHHIAPASGSQYAIDSQLTKAMRDLAPRFEHRLFLSATPHNGHSNSFSALLEILDPQRFLRGLPIKDPRLLEAVMVRRLKEDLRAVGQEGFPRREVVAHVIRDLPEDAPELVLAELLDKYQERRGTRFADAPRAKQALAKLLTTGLQQRLFSSIEAFARTLRVHRRTVEKAGAATVASLPLLDLVKDAPGSDDERATLPAEELAREEETQVAQLSAATGAIPAAERQLLDQMYEVAEKARGRADARVRELVTWIRTNLCPTPSGKNKTATWNNRRLLVFTEYEDTLRYLHEQLTGELADTDQADDRIALYRGSTNADDRKRIQKAFNADPAVHPLRILLANDAAREGLNLQAHCADLFHFDVPWNPARMEQRNGRIDRKLQTAPVVRCHYFLYEQRSEDRILSALVRKSETIKKELGSLNPLIEARLASPLAEGLSRQRLGDIEQAIENTQAQSPWQQVINTELEDTREREARLARQLETLRTLHRTSNDWIDLQETSFRDAISTGLELMGAARLQPLADGQFAFPALDKQEGHGARWSTSLDTLRVPREKDQSLWDWRREAPLRPVVFADPGKMTDEVAHLHLEHPVVQRILNHFIAQGFVHHDLARACITQTADSHRRVLLIGRLCLFGAGASRLHEQLLVVSATWLEASLRKPALKVDSDAETEKIQATFRGALTHRQAAVSPVITRLLQQHAPRDVEELLPHLESRGEQVGKEARRLLRERATREAEAMKKILEAQKKRIETESDKFANVLFKFKDEEKKQMEADQRHWNKRLDSLEQEIADEPTRIRKLYTVEAQRLEPVGLVYLWPISG